MADDLAARRQHGLSVEIEDGRLVIAIGIDALMTAIDTGPHSPGELGYRVLDTEGFANDVAHALQREEDDGTTQVHRVLDKATLDAIEDGSAHVRFEGDPT